MTENHLKSRAWKKWTRCRATIPTVHFSRIEFDCILEARQRKYSTFFQGIYILSNSGLLPGLASLARNRYWHHCANS